MPATGERLNPSQGPRTRGSKAFLRWVAYAGVATDSLSPVMILVGPGAVGLTIRLFAAMAVALGLGWLLAVPVVRRYRGLGVLLLAFAVLAAIWGVVIGLARLNPTTYLAADAVRMTIFAFAIFLGLRLGDDDRRAFVLAMWRAFVVVEVVRSLAFVLALSQGAYFRFGGGSAVALAMAIGLPSTGESSTWRIFSWFGRTAIVFNLLTALVRSLWLVAALQLVLWCWRIRVGAGRGLRRALTVVVLGFLVVLAGEILGASILRPIEQRVAISLGRASSDSSVVARQDEVARARAALDRMSWPELGAGFGAVSGPTRDDESRTIHDSEESLRFRLGWSGLGLWIGILIVGARALAFALFARKPGALELTVAVATVGAVIAGKFFYGVVGVIPVAFVLALSSTMPFRPRDGEPMRAGRPSDASLTD